MVEHDLSRGRSITHVNVTRDPNGWEVRQEFSQGEARISHYSDWHRVETAVRSIELNQLANTTQSDASD